ncbi:MAG: hypothetical protein ACRDT4_06035 [Micromonosporaceae bacterium]
MLCRQYRHTVGKVVLPFPAGGVDDRESAEDAARTVTTSPDRRERENTSSPLTSASPALVQSAAAGVDAADAETCGAIRNPSAAAAAISGLHTIMAAPESPCRSTSRAPPSPTWPRNRRARSGEVAAARYSSTSSGVIASARASRSVHRKVW